MPAVELTSVLKGHEGDRVWHVSWNFDGKYLCSCGEDKVIRIWGFEFNPSLSAYQINCISTLEDGQIRTIRCCEWSKNDRYIASASFDGTVFIWQSMNTNKTTWEKIASLEGHDNEVKCVAWNHNDDRLATCGRDKKVWVWEILSSSDFECVAILEGHTQDVKFVKWHPYEPLLFSCSYDDTIRIWKDDGEDIYCVQVLQGHTSTIWGLSINHQGDEIYSCGDDGTIGYWKRFKPADNDEYNLVTIYNSEHDGPIYSIDINDQNVLITAGGDNSIVVRNTGKSNIIIDPSHIEKNDISKIMPTIVTIPCAHMNDINCIRWNPRRMTSSSASSSSSSTLFATCGDDSMIKIWNYIS